MLLLTHLFSFGYFSVSKYNENWNIFFFISFPFVVNVYIWAGGYIKHIFWWKKFKGSKRCGLTLTLLHSTIVTSTDRENAKGVEMHDWMLNVPKK